MKEEKRKEVVRMMKSRGISIYSLKDVFLKENGKPYSKMALYAFLKGRFTSKRLEDCFNLLYKKLFDLPPAPALDQKDFKV